MSDRRALRGSQVRPRPPSSVRSTPQKLRPRPSPYRVAQHKPIARGPGIPFIGRAVLALGVVALGAVVLYSATGQIGRIMGGVGGAVSSFLTNAGANPSQAVASGVVAGAPTIVAPDEAYTSDAAVDITGTVPIGVIGSTDYTISLYQALQGQQPTLVQQNVAIPRTATFTIPGVSLKKGTNVFTATIVGPGGESSPSSPVTYVLDTTKPKITITSPKEGARVNGTSVEIKGRTQGNSTVQVENTTNRNSSSTTANKAGAFTISVAVAQGSNTITITATDPASNTAAITLKLTRGAGKLALGLTSSQNSFSAKKGATLIFTATLKDPDGKPIVNQSVTLTITLAGLGPDVRAGLRTDSQGRVAVSYRIHRHAADGGAGKWGQVIASASTRFGNVQKTIQIKTES
ncbi:MAG: Ig-like domain-containing protein [Chloroflexota bacterium]|nr:Ig-like domain-containing protein [Chloroflexota bacterium]